jgi:hypothetical protein
MSGPHHQNGDGRDANHALRDAAEQQPDQAAAAVGSQHGLLLLIATPVARVAFSLVAFARQRDAIYVIVTSIVLAVLVYSLAGGRL